MKRICNGDDDLSKNSAALGPKTFEQGIQVFHETIQQDFLRTALVEGQSLSHVITDPFLNQTEF